MRNFYVQANMSGRATVLAGGPRSKEGGMMVVIKQRNEGLSTTAVTITCIADAEGNLVTQVFTAEGQVAEVVTKR